MARRPEIMYLPSAPEMTGPIPSTMPRGGRESTKQPWMTKKQSSLVSEELVLPQIDPSVPATADVIAAGVVPEITPVFLGVRARLAQRRIDSYQNRIEELAHRPPTRREVVGRHVGESILRGKGYWRHDNRLRPARLSERLTAYALEQLTASRKWHLRKSSANAQAYYPRVGTVPPEAELTPRFDQANVKPLRKEARNDSSNAASYRKFDRKIDRRDAAFAFVISPSQVRAQRLVRKRDQAIRKLQAIENSQAARRTRP